MKKRVVDLDLGLRYGDVDLDENPCIFPRCGHFLTMKSMDVQMEIKEFYAVDGSDRPIRVLAPIPPLSIEDGAKTCAICHGPLRDIARYGRLVRRMLLDASTKNLNVYHNRECATLMEELSQHIQQLQQVRAPRPIQWTGTIQVGGPRNTVISTMAGIMEKPNPGRWDKMVNLRQRTTEYRRRVTSVEQRFHKVHNMVHDCQKRQKKWGRFTVEDEILPTENNLPAIALDIRLDIALIADLLSPAHLLQMGDMKIELNLHKIRDECNVLSRTAGRRGRWHQQLEGLIFMAQLYALERPHASPEQAQSCLELGHAAIKKSRQLCKEHPPESAGFANEVNCAENMLTQGTFYVKTPSEECIAAIIAMTSDFIGIQGRSTVTTRRRVWRREAAGLVRGMR